MDESGDVVRHHPFPYPGGGFPPDLGAVVQRTVMDGLEPARIVVHDADGDWSIADGVNDPNEPDASLVTHIRHLVESDPTLGELSSLRPGHFAEREHRGGPWHIAEHRYDDA